LGKKERNLQFLGPDEEFLIPTVRCIKEETGNLDRIKIKKKKGAVQRMKTDLQSEIFVN
jgi:hypothetical protein